MPKAGEYREYIPKHRPATLTSIMEIRTTDIRDLLLFRGYHPSQMVPGYWDALLKEIFKLEELAYGKKGT